MTICICPTTQVRCTRGCERECYLADDGPLPHVSYETRRTEGARQVEQIRARHEACGPLCSTDVEVLFAEHDHYRALLERIRDYAGNTTMSVVYRWVERELPDGSGDGE